MNGMGFWGGSASVASHLQISVEPVQASFFAGEEFACVITFTNTRTPVPQTQPLPSRATFESVRDDGEDVRRAVSSSAAPTPLYSEADDPVAAAASTSNDGQKPSRLPRPIDIERAMKVDEKLRAEGPASAAVASAASLKSLQTASSLASLSPSSGFHRKSQSVDIRTFTRRHQLDRHLPLDTEASDEHYYRTQSQLTERGDNMYALQAQELLESMPGRRKLIGKGISGPLTPLPSSALMPSTSHNEKAAPGSSFFPKTHNKAYSVAIPGEQPRENGFHLGLGHAPTDQNGRDTNPSFSSPRMPSHRFPIDASSPSPASSRAPSGASTRKPSATISPMHPHSRKKSVAQFHTEDLSATFEADRGPDGAVANGGGHHPYSQSSRNVSRPSLDSQVNRVAEGNGFYELGENSTMESVLREDISQIVHRDSNGSPYSSSMARGRNNAQSSSASSGKETILWTFAQFGGHFQLDESLVKPGEFEQVKQRLINTTGAGPSPGMMNSPPAAVGGGELEAAMEAEALNRSRSEGWGSYLRNALSSDRGRSSSTSISPSGHRKSPSTLFHNQQRTMASRTIPVLSNPPSMVAVDLELAPGEQRSYTWRVPLPPDLPPSYMGRAISFNYTLTLGTNRLVQTRRGLEQKSRLVRIPMRIYNHVNLSGVTGFYDLTNPIINHRDEAIVLDELERQDVRQTGRNDSNSTAPSSAASLDISRGKDGLQFRKRRSSRAEVAADHDLLRYAHDLIETCQDEDAASDEEEASIEIDDGHTLRIARRQRLQDMVRTSPNTLRSHLALPSAPHDKVEFRGKAHRGLPDASQAGLGLINADDDDLPKNSLQAIAILSRNAQKVSYDITKDGQVAATLTLVKSKYRLGDSVVGVVTMNAAHSVARVVRIAATLETHEEIEATLSTLPAGRVQKLTRTVHASCHDSTLDAGQAKFSLAIPSGATPNFDTSAVRLAWTIRLAFLTQSCVREDGANGALPRQKPPPHLTWGRDDGYGAYHKSMRGVPSLVVAASSLAPAIEDNPASSSASEVKLEVVECAVPLTVLPHSTRFTAGEVAFAA